jgi:hypothetical protein
MFFVHEYLFVPNIFRNSLHLEISFTPIVLILIEEIFSTDRGRNTFSPQVGEEKIEEAEESRIKGNKLH